MKRFALSILLMSLALCGTLAAQTSTVTFTVTGSEHSCNNVAYCIYTLGGNMQTATWWLYGAGWSQFGVGGGGTLFCSPNALNTSPYNPTANPIMAACAGISTYDNTPYTLTLSATYRKIGCGRGGCWYQITGGTASLTASDGTLHALGVTGY